MESNFFIYFPKPVLVHLEVVWMYPEMGTYMSNLQCLVCNGLYLKHWFQILSCYYTQTAHSKYFPSFLTFKRSSDISSDLFLSGVSVPLEIPPFLWPFSGNMLYAEGHAVIIVLIWRNTKGFNSLEILPGQNITVKNY